MMDDTKPTDKIAVRVPAEFKAALEKMLEGRPHLTLSDLVREAIFRFLESQEKTHD